ncbi:MAG: hypothetical protein ACI92N_004051, partial [Pseudomonadales bacterium]
VTDSKNVGGHGRPETSHRDVLVAVFGIGDSTPASRR